MFQIVDYVNCSASMNTLIDAVKFVLNLIRWAIPVVLIILGSIDMFKAMASGDDKEAEKGKKTFIRRLVYAVVAFLIPFIVTLTFDVVSGIVDDNNANTSTLDNQNLKDGNFFDCWNGTESTPKNNPSESNDEEEMCNCYICQGTDNCTWDYETVSECATEGICQN